MSDLKVGDVVSVITHNAITDEIIDVIATIVKHVDDEYFSYSCDTQWLELTCEGYGWIRGIHQSLMPADTFLVTRKQLEEWSRCIDINERMSIANIKSAENTLDEINALLGAEK